MPRDASGHLVAGRLSAQRAVPSSIPKPPYVGKPAPPAHVGGDVYDADTIELIRESGRIAAQAIEAVGAAIVPGVTTDELDR
ncbi:MAG: type I methionyl aminopeptidase, partial [Microcella sp.]|nr:type I methionyl aminopeptidase [Microcella sp.]